MRSSHGIAMILLPLLEVTSKGIHSLSHVTESRGVVYCGSGRLPIYGCILQLMWILPWRPGAKGDHQQGSSTPKNHRPELKKSFEQRSCPEWSFKSMAHCLSRYIFSSHRDFPYDICEYMRPPGACGELFDKQKIHTAHIRLAFRAACGEM